MAGSSAHGAARLGTPACLQGAWRVEAQAVTLQTPAVQRSSRNRRRCSLRVEARDRQRRLLSLVLSAPKRVDRYLKSSWWRRWMWAGISLSSGFYAGNIATLSFGALAVNDVFAAVITLLFCEVAAHLYYTDTTGSITLWYLNCMKMGVRAALLADAIKLGS